MSLLRVTDAEGVVEVRLNRPEKRNALNRQMLGELSQVMYGLRSRRDVRAVILAGEGPVFCAGADLREFGELPDGEAVQEWITSGLRAFRGIAEHPTPVIAAIQGGAYGGGLELAMHCDIRVLGSDAVLSLPEVSMGWRPDWGAIDLLPQVVSRSRVIHMVLTGARVTAEDARGWGLVSEVSDDPLARARAIARSFADNPSDVISEVLPLLRPRMPDQSGGRA